MIRLVKYLKPYTLSILAAILLLFIQAQTDLALPDYLSRIVNYGIQMGGVENAIPAAIRQSQMERLFLFLSAEEKTAVLNAYTLVDSSSPDYAQTVKAYPNAANLAIYVRKSLSQAEIDRLNPLLAKAELAVYGIQQAAADPSKAAAMGAASGFDLSKLPKGADVFALLAKMPPAARQQMIDAMAQKFSAMGDKAVIQAAAPAVQAEYVALGLNEGQLQSSYIIQTGEIMLLISLLGVATAFGVGYLSSRTAAGLARDLRRDVFQKVESFSSSEFDRFSTASLITRSTNDITQIQMVTIMLMRMVFYAPIMGVGGIIRAVNKDVSMWWIIALAVAVLISLIVTIFSLSVPKFRIMQSLIDRLNLVTRENLAGMMVIRSFNMQPFELQRFDKANQDLTDTNLYVTRVMTIMWPFMTIILNGVSLLILWVGAHQVAQSNMQVGDMMAFMQYAIQIVFSFMFLSFAFFIIPRASVSAGRIAEVLATQIAIHDPAQPRHLPANFEGTIEFDNVSFRYPGADEDVLCGISFTAQPGQTTAFIGATGSGKSTVVNLIPRFYDITSGSIRLDGVDIREVTQHELREKIGYVPQKSALFSGTIESNLRYAAENAPQEELRAAADIAQASEFIDSKAEGMAAEISQGGSNVSGGQKQRLSIARALAKKAPIYIFDDSFSALDFKTDAALRRALKDKTAASTLLLVTQRVSTIKNADQIVVLDDGKVVGKGTHSDLMKTCDTYKEIAMSQLSLEELS